MPLYYLGSNFMRLQDSFVQSNASILIHSKFATKPEQARLAQQTAFHSLKKDARVNICISSHDLLCLKQQAAYKGLRY